MRAIVGSFLILSLAFLIFVAVMLGIARGNTKERPNTLGVAQFYNNPYAYLLALPMDGQIFEGKYTNIRLSPYGASGLYDESVLFCGDVTPMFEGKKGVLILVYRIQAEHMYRGLGCHALLSVFQVQITKEE